MAKTPKKSTTTKVKPKKSTSTKKVLKEQKGRYSKKDGGTGDGGPRSK